MLAFGGYITAAQDVTESWNGSSWTEVGDLNTARYGIAGSGSTYTSVLAFGGQPGTGGSANETEEWNGSSWTEVNNLNTARTHMGGAGSSTEGLGFAGEGPPVTGATEEWAIPTTNTVTFTVS